MEAIRSTAQAASDSLVRELIESVGEDPQRDGLRDTPRRYRKAFGEMTSGYSVDVDRILSVHFESSCDEMVIVRGIPFVSLCEHHLLPFTGVVHVGYIPGGRVVGLSKIPRVVQAYAKRLQIQERLTQQIATALADHVPLNLGVGVRVVAHHSCMSLRGVRSEGDMVSTCLLGAIREDSSARAEFLGVLV